MSPTLISFHFRATNSFPTTVFVSRLLTSRSLRCRAYVIQTKTINKRRNCFERTISSLASLIAVKAKTNTSGKIVVIGANELICGIS
jgi:hypothetical protein